MTMTNVELYEALKGSIPDKAARLIAEVFPQASDVSTKHDLEVAVARLEGKIDTQQANTLRWMIAMFVPMWMGTWATVAAVILKG